MKAKGISYEGVGKVVMFVIEKVSPLDGSTKVFLKDTDPSPGDYSGPDKDQTKRIARIASYILEA